ncbi:MAG: hypothetical protein AMXMBFR6_19690 [Betaproteobacteria bacterium]
MHESSLGTDRQRFYLVARATPPGRPSGPFPKYPQRERKPREACAVAPDYRHHEYLTQLKWALTNFVSSNIDA